ncbi:uncharacterized protein LOC124695991 [Lolium rigidum]|uniref:uncharacterized protein LOC124695991 n=1 Tax=Lolium rigidum TaxID=89674 RepID=UPI001F5DAF48|nr:uncharacterized protein LOC124695991 [Lolium rigidum]
MATRHLLLILLLTSILHAASSIPGNSTVDAPTATAYDVLEQNNLPRGLLPLGVKSYAYHDGVLDVTLSVPEVCDFFVTIDGRKYLIRYGNRDGGVIAPGSITKVHSVRMQDAWGLWRGFAEVTRVGDQLEFLVAEQETRSFPVSAFAHSPRCNKGSV